MQHSFRVLLRDLCITQPLLAEGDPAQNELGQCRRKGLPSDPHSNVTGK